MDEKLVLNEAEGFNPGDTLLGGEVIPTSAADSRWNDLFKKYRDTTNIKYYFITVEGFVRKVPIEGEPNRGFIKFTGKTSMTQSKKFLVFGGRFEDSIDSDQIRVVENEEEATAFKGEDVGTVINAIKKNKDFDLRNARFGRVDVSDEILAGMNIANQLIMSYFNVLCDDEGASAKLRNALSMLNTICRPRNNPLVGNPIFDMLKSILKANPSFNVNATSVLTLNNIVADRVLRANDIINPNSILGSLCYNNNLYKYRVKQIESIFDAYSEAKGIPGNITIPQLTELGTEQDEIKRQFAKNLILIADDSDPLVAIISGKANEDDKLPVIGYKPEGIILTGQVRSPDACDAILNAVLSGNERKESDASRLIFTLSTEPGTETTSKTLSDEEGIFKLEFANVNFQEGSTVKIFVGDKKDINLLSGLIKGNYFEGSKDFKVEDNNLIVTKGQKASVIVNADSSRGYAIIGMKLIPSGTAREEPKKEKAKEETPEETTTTSDVIKPGEKFAGKTIDEIAAMSRDEFRAFKPSLTPEEATRLKSFGGRFLGI